MRLAPGLHRLELHRELDALLDEVRLTRSKFLRAGLATGAGALAAGAPAVAEAASGHTHEYWVAAVPATWNVVPNGRNAIEGMQMGMIGLYRATRR